MISVSSIFRSYLIVAKIMGWLVTLLQSSSNKTTGTRKVYDYVSLYSNSSVV